MVAELLTQAVPKSKSKVHGGIAAKAVPVSATMKVVRDTDAQSFTVPELATLERPWKRHIGVLLSFLLCVVVPAALTAGYLSTRAADQFASRVGFSVRQMNQSTSGALVGLTGLAGFAGLSGSASDDGNILNDFLQSHEIVAQLDSDLDLRGIWSRYFETDPLFSFDEQAAFEDLHRFWGSMVHVNYDNSAGIVSVEARAFSAQEAQLIASAIAQASSMKINDLSRIAQEDAIRLSQIEFEETKAKLSNARNLLSEFRNQSQIIDPSASLQIHMGLLGNLQSQLADTLIRHDLLAGTTHNTDRRLIRIKREIDIIEKRIAAEKANLGLGGKSIGARPFAVLIGEYETIEIEMRFATEAYVQAQTALNLARTDARRQSRYLATHVSPTLPESSEYPKKPRLTLMVSAFLFLGWALVSLKVSSLRARR